ncbi:shikimate kinase [Nocardia caishijiensis]|uniref:Shikimate kinase n=1 Tax=Nocardia caishijiensis TaxID=184756 RepID=A0ABQ6YNU4_9NOCA|nr:shikimate kinase [Nocardia caishijiensis]
MTTPGQEGTARDADAGPSSTTAAPGTEPTDHTTTSGADASDGSGAKAGDETVVAARARVVLVGPPGSGKSTIGRKLARELGVELFDTDAGIEVETGRSIPEIFATDGEPEFRRIEEQVVRRAVLEHEGVVSLGGGSVLSARTREVLRGATVVYLEISVGEGLRRTGSSTARPLLNGADPAAKYRELMKQRRPLYREVATVRVRTDGRSPGRVVRMILGRLGLESVRTDIARTADAVNPTPPLSSTAPGSGSSRSKARRRSRARAAAARRGEMLAASGTQGDNDATTAAAARSASGRAVSGEAPPGENRRSRRNRSRRRGSRSRAVGGATDSTRSAEKTGTASADDARPGDHTDDRPQPTDRGHIDTGVGERAGGTARRTADSGAESSAEHTEDARATRPTRRGRAAQPGSRTDSAPGAPTDAVDTTGATPAATGRTSGSPESSRRRRGGRGSRGGARQSRRRSSTDHGAEPSTGSARRTDTHTGSTPAHDTGRIDTRSGRDISLDSTDRPGTRAAGESTDRPGTRAAGDSTDRPGTRAAGDSTDRPGTHADTDRIDSSVGDTDPRGAQQPPARGRAAAPGAGEPVPGSWRARPRRRATRRMTNDPRESEQRT